MFNPLGQSLLLNQSSHRAQQARLVLEEEKADHSVWARLKDTLLHTQAQSENEDAQVALSICEDEIAELAPQWVESRIFELVSANHTPETRELMGLLPALNKARERCLRVKHLRDTARAALEELRDAATQCDNAASGELMDAMSSLRPSKSLHDHEMEEVKHAIHRAHSALVRLASEIEVTRVEGVDDADDGWWGQTLDFEVSSISGLNLSALEHARESCRKIIPHVEQMLSHLALATDRQSLQLDKVKSSYASIEAPFRQEVLLNMPENIRDLLVKRNLCLGPPDHEIKLSSTTGHLDFDVLKRARDA